MDKKIYYKSFDGNLCGYGGFQYEVGKTYKRPLTDRNAFEWFHYAGTVTSTLANGNYTGKNTRICEVKPIGETEYFRNVFAPTKKAGYFTTNQIAIIRELSRDEIFDLLEKEKSKYFYFKELMPEYKHLLKRKKEIRGFSRVYEIIQRSDLSFEEKKQLIPQKWMYELEDHKKRHPEYYKAMNEKREV